MYGCPWPDTKRGSGYILLRLDAPAAFFIFCLLDHGVNVMGTQSNRNKKALTNPSQANLQFCQRFSSLGEIVGWLVDIRLRAIRPEIAPRAYVSSRPGISESELCLIISNQRTCKLNQFCSIASICKAPEVFQYLQHFTFSEEAI